MSFFSSRRQPDNEADKQPSKPIPQHPVGFETVIGTGSTIEGKLTCKGNIRLDGDFTGTLDIQGNILVGETAKITADIEARNISIAGAVRGNVTGNKIQLLRTGRIWGDITANALTTEEGAFIDGKITMKSHEANRPVEKNEDSDATMPDVIRMDDSPTEAFKRPPELEVAAPDDDTIVEKAGGLVDLSAEEETEPNDITDPNDTTDPGEHET